MLKAILPAIALVAIAAPAAAQDQGRVEARGGIAWANGGSEAIAGAAAGWDWSLGEPGGAFFGAEASVDKILVGGTDVVFGLTGRLGTQVGEQGRLYANAGYSFNDGDAFHAGAGYEHGFGSNVYGKVEYRRFFLSGTDINAATVGVGVRF